MCLLAYFAMVLAEPISDRLGTKGLEIVVRLMGLIVLAIAAEMVFHGIADHFGLTVFH